MFEDYQPYKNPTLAGVILPSVKIDQRHYDALEIPSTTSNYDFLRKLCWKGIQEKGIDKLPNAKEYYDRVKKELETFNELSFTEYILLNWLILNFCDEQRIVIGPGRGSCVGSLVLYLLKVTRIDPLKNNLYFERFVSKNRAKKITHEGVTYLDGSLLPDCDHDIEFQSRQKVIDFINQQFDGQTSKILTLNTLSGKACIKECLKIAEGCSEDEAAYVADSIPKKFGKVLDFEDAIKESPKFAELVKKHSKAYEIAKKLEGLIKNVGMHPSGIAICSTKIDDVIPLQSTKEGDVISGFEMGDVGSLMVKFDILGLRTLSVIQQTAEMVGIDPKTFSVPEKDTYCYLQNLVAPHGLFQIETDVGFGVCQKVRPENLDELADVLSLSRPGSIAFVEEYANVKNALQEPTERWPSLDAILNETKGTILFQETVMRVCHEVFGLSLLDAESVRRACGKKKKEEMEIWEPVIFSNAKEKGIPESVAKFFWDAMIASADYSFNKCLAKDTIINTPLGTKTLKQIKAGDEIFSLDMKTNNFIPCKVKDIHESVAEVFEFEFEDGRTIHCSMEHKFLTKNGMLSIKEIIKNNEEIIIDDTVEFFKGVSGYERLYKISNKATIRSLVGHGMGNKLSKNYGGKVLTPAKDQDGYRMVHLCNGKNGTKMGKVHRLMAIAWIPNPDNLPEVNHLDGRRDNNQLENLEWTTCEENIRHSRACGFPRKKPEDPKYSFGEKSPWAKLTEKEVLEMRKIRDEEKLSYPKLAKAFNVSSFAAWSICMRKSWRHI